MARVLFVVIGIVLVIGTGGEVAAQTTAIPILTGYYLGIEGNAIGPYDTIGLWQLMVNGQLTRDSLVWKEGMKNWAAASTVKVLDSLFSMTPPPLPQQATQSQATRPTQTTQTTPPQATRTTQATPPPAQRVASTNVEAGVANYKTNWISGEISLLGLGVRYERMLNSQWSVGANVYWTSFIFIYTEYSADATVRFYPWGKTFFTGIGVGYHDQLWTGSGFALTPEVGWKIDVGEKGSFFLQPGIKLPVNFPVLNRYWTDEFVVGFFPPLLYFGMGGMF
jgi:hypothetical protein